MHAMKWPGKAQRIAVREAWSTWSYEERLEASKIRDPAIVTWHCTCRLGLKLAASSSELSVAQQSIEHCTIFRDGAIQILEGAADDRGMINTIFTQTAKTYTMHERALVLHLGAYDATWEELAMHYYTHLMTAILLRIKSNKQAVVTSSSSRAPSASVRRRRFADRVANALAWNRRRSEYKFFGQWQRVMEMEALHARAMARALDVSLRQKRLRASLERFVNAVLSPQEHVRRWQKAREIQARAARSMSISLCLRLRTRRLQESFHLWLQVSPAVCRLVIHNTFYDFRKVNPSSVRRASSEPSLEPRTS